jgi:hypothetical protein
MRMSSIIRARSGVVFSSMGTSCLTIEKVPIVRPQSPIREAQHSDQWVSASQGRQCRESGFVLADISDIGHPRGSRG